jgi:hypothetical protein
LFLFEALFFFSFFFPNKPAVLTGFQTRKTKTSARSSGWHRKWACFCVTQRSSFVESELYSKSPSCACLLVQEHFLTRNGSEYLPGFSGKEEKHAFGACDVYRCVGAHSTHTHTLSLSLSLSLSFSLFLSLSLSFSFSVSLSLSLSLSLCLSLAAHACTPNVEHKLTFESFGIVMWEIGARAEPYGGLTAQDGLKERILDGERPERTRSIQSFIPPEYGDIMREAWAPSSHKRPTFKDLLAPLKRLKPKQQAFSTTVLEKANADFGRMDTRQLREREVLLQRQGSVENHRSNSVSGSYVNVLPPSQRARPSVSARYSAVSPAHPSQIELLVVNSGSEL